MGGQPVLFGVILLVVGLIGFLIGRRWGWNALVVCLFAEGYVISMDKEKRHGAGRFVVDEAEEPPF